MGIKTIALIGQPNAGKSTLFNVLSDIKTNTSNFPGTTVEYKSSSIDINGETYNLIDLPGTYSLNPMDEAESISYNYLVNNKVDLVINVVDSTMIARSFELTIELIELGLPMVIALNMQDEAERHGFRFDLKKLESFFNVPVVSTIAVFGKGIKTLINKAQSVIQSGQTPQNNFEFTHHIEVKIQELISEISKSKFETKFNTRFYAIKSIENQTHVPSEILENIFELKKSIEADLVEQHHRETYELISYERHHYAMKIAEEITAFRQRKERPLFDKLDDLLLNKYAGYFFLAMFFLFYFGVIFIVGQSLSGIIDYPIQQISLLLLPLKSNNLFLWYTVNGLYQGFAGVIGIVLPYFLPLIFLTALFEDSGYMARIAFLIDGLMHKIGLHGKSVVPFILGFGCSVPAIYATRIIENKRDRIITGALIPLIPCSARISVIFALAAAFTGPIWAMVVFFYVIFVIALSGKVMSKFSTKPTGLILEIPDLKVPSLTLGLKKTWLKIKEFSKYAMLFLLGGSLVLAWIEYFKVFHYVNYVFLPIVHNLLGLPIELGSTLVFGFLRKELILVMMTQAMNVSSISQLPMTTAQILIFVIFVTLYFPCLSTLISLIREFGIKVGLLSSSFSIILATLSAYIFKIILNI